MIKEETKVELNKAMSPEANKVTFTDEQGIKTDEKETACKNENNKDTEIKPKSEAKASKNLEEPKCDRKMTEEEVKDMVEKVEGKCKNIRGDIADMAMSEQYLRTKQALLMAKKKEQEMKIAQKMASIRETEVQKMKEKVEHMQNLLKQRKEKLQITEELMAEKEGEKKNIDKQIEATKRRENYVENQIMETVMFEKPPKKK